MGDGRRVRHWPRDTGRGEDRIFDQLSRGSSAAEGSIPGMGLGLSIVQEIVRAHAGRVTVQSELGQGSVFTLWLPAARETGE
jgi:signal transduction histidine kinase